MLKEELMLNLTLFGEGGDGGDGGATSAAGENAGGATGEDFIPSSIPERAKKYYKKAMEKNTKQVATASDLSTSNENQPTNDSKAEDAKLSYADLINSEEYKADHQAYMDKTIGERLKKYKGIEKQFEQARGILDIVAGKYGIDPTSDTYLEDLKEKAEADDTYYEKYAQDHDISTTEARRVVQMEQRVAQYDEEKRQREKQEQVQAQVLTLQKNAERTKAQFPGFSLEAEWENENFRRLCFASNGDTTAAYMACHWNEVLPATVQRATEKVKAQTVNSIASGQTRPVENGTNAVAPSVVTRDFRNMSLKDIRAQADAWRRNGKGR